MNSLYLYVALIGVAFVLFALTRSSKGTPLSSTVSETLSFPTSVGVDPQLKDTLDEFMNELEKDNQQVLDSLTQLQIDYKQQLEQQQQQIQRLERRVLDLEKRPAQTVIVSAPPTEPVGVEEAVAPPPPAFAFNEKYARVVELFEQGRNVDQIARDTGIGLGEIHMVLGLAKREERS